MTNNLRVTITKTADGDGEYIQIMSGDCISVNVVLVADVIEVKDTRSKQKKVRSGLGRRVASISLKLAVSNIYQRNPVSMQVVTHPNAHT